MEYMSFTKTMGREKNTRPIGLVKNEILWGGRYDVFNIIYIIMIIKKINSPPKNLRRFFLPPLPDPCQKRDPRPSSVERELASNF
jgi:hypothetical protein